MPPTPISIVIRTLNSAATFGRVLEALNQRPDDQIIVVDSGSTDTTLELAHAAGACIVPIERSRFTYGRALNLGFEAARHPWVLSLSSHTVPTSNNFLDTYRQAVDRFPATVSASVGPIIGEFDAAIPGGITLFEGDDLRMGFGFGAGNPNALYRRIAWESRRFDEEIGGGEDLQWYLDALKSGETVAAVHAARVYYISRQSIRAFYRKGRVDYRAASRLIQAHRPTLPGLFIRAAKLMLYLPMGKVDWYGAKGSLAHCLGSYMEARSSAHSRKSGDFNRSDQ